MNNIRDVRPGLLSTVDSLLFHSQLKRGINIWLSCTCMVSYLKPEVHLSLRRSLYFSAFSYRLLPAKGWDWLLPVLLRGRFRSSPWSEHTVPFQEGSGAKYRELPGGEQPDCHNTGIRTDRSGTKMCVFGNKCCRIDHGHWPCGRTV